MEQRTKLTCNQLLFLFGSLQNTDMLDNITWALNYKS